MLVSTSAEISNNFASSGVVQKILEIQEQMAMINKHRREHIGNNTNEACVYCQRKMQMLGRQDTARTKKKVRTLNEIERSVDTSGKNGCVIVPRTWAGKRVKITLLDEKA
jgi:putative transposon-encoded protein